MKGKIWFVINTFFSIVYLVWRLFFTLPFEYGFISVFIGIALFVVEALGMVEALIHYMNMYDVRGYKKPRVDKSLFPDVDIFIATYNEEPELLYKTINGCKHMEYPDKSKVHIYLCDDNRRPQMRELAERMGINYFDRPDNEGAKAGNFNHALARTSSPYIVTFDADMIPQRRFLMETIPFFVDAELKNEGKKEEEKIKLGYVQSPQAFYNPDMFQFGLFSENRIPNEQDYFYKDIEVARTKTNSVIYGGSNTVIAREALEAVGGFYTEAITEDFATGILIQRKGFVTLGINETIASGMSPTDLPNLIQQRIRWGRGVISTGRQMHIFTCKELSFAQKLNYWASIWYWYAPVKRFIYIISPIMFAVFGFTIFKCTLLEALLFWLPMFVTSNISLRMLSGNIRTTKWTGVYETIMFPYMFLPIILETFGLSLRKFKVTQKADNSGKKKNNIVYMVPFMIMIVLTIIGVIRCILIMFDSNSISPVIVLFWLLLNGFYIQMSILFVDGRIPYRKSERTPLSVPCTVKVNDKIINGHTLNVSEEGLAVGFDLPYYIEEDLEVEVELSWDIYKAVLKSKNVYVRKDEKNDEWSYSFKITDYLDSYDDWLQIIYDRSPALPEAIKKDSGIFEDLQVNVKKRFETPFFQKRSFPRVPIDEEVTWIYNEKVGSVKLIDFNYCYVSVPKMSSMPKEARIVLVDDIEINCRYTNKIVGSNTLYEITDIEQIIKDVDKYNRLLIWLNAREHNYSREEEIITVERERRKHEKEMENRIVFNETDLI